MIVRDGEELLPECLDSIHEYMDEIVIALDSRTTDRTREIAESYGDKVKVYDYEWDDTKFQGARRFSFEKTTGEAILWLDVDDRVLDAKFLRKLAYDHIINGDVSCIFMPWDYCQDGDGNSLVSLIRERIVRRGKLQWNGVIHEVLHPLEAMNQITVDKCLIRHESQNHEAFQKSERAYNEFIKKYEEAPDSMADRDWWYLAQTTVGIGDLDRGVKYMCDHMKRRSVITDNPYIYMQRISLSDIYMGRAKYDEAIACLLPAMAGRPDEALGWLRLAEAYKGKKRYKDCIFFVSVGLKKEKTLSLDLMSLNPQYYNLLPFLSLAESFLGLGDLDSSRKALEKAREEYPESTLISIAEKHIDEVEAKLALSESHLVVASSKGYEDAREYVDSLDPSFVVNRAFGKWTHHRPENYDKEVVFLNHEKTLLNIDCRMKGSGASEEFLVEYAEGLARRGYRVTIYSPLDVSVGWHRGVRYLPIDHFQAEENQPIVICWRSPVLADGIKYPKQLLLFLHDQVQPEVIKGQRMDRLDALICQTQDHMDRYPFVEEKGYLVTSGIHPEEYVWDSPIRDFSRVVYMSRPERGLVDLLEMWPEIKDKNPKAQLTLCTGMDVVGAGRIQKDLGYKQMLDWVTP
jgi:glycosyltransferase involved in cell wall biosynthesis